MSRGLDASFHFLFLSFALLGWLNIKGPRRSYVLFAGLFLLFTFLFDGLAVSIMLNKYLANFFKSNLFLYHILTPIQFALIMLLYNNVITGKFWKKITVIVIPLFTFLCLFFTFYVQGFMQANSYSILIKYTVFILIILIYFYELLSATPYVKIYKEPVFWFSIGFFFHSTFNIFLDGFSNYLHTYGDSTYGVVFFLYSISNYFLFILLAIGMYTCPRKSQKNEQSIA